MKRPLTITLISWFFIGASVMEILVTFWMMTKADQPLVRRY